MCVYNDGWVGRKIRLLEVWKKTEMDYDECLDRTQRFMNNYEYNFNFNKSLHKLPTN